MIGYRDKKNINILRSAVPDKGSPFVIIRRMDFTKE